MESENQEEASIIRIAACNLCQNAMDFENNKNHIIESIRQAKQNKCMIRVGPELEISGYDCEDHFSEMDTYKHSWQVLEEILSSKVTNGIICFIGLPVIYNNITFNAVAVVYNSKILLIRPKSFLSNSRVYRENRYFTPYQRRTVNDFILPESTQNLTGQKSTLFGLCMLRTNDSIIGIEIGQEYQYSNSPHISMSLDGADIIVNASSSNYTVGKQLQRMQELKLVSKKNGIVYVFSNQKGCCGNRNYYDGNASIYFNGFLLAKSNQFQFQNVECVYANVDLQQLKKQRIGQKLGGHGQKSKKWPEYYINLNICQSGLAKSKPLVYQRKYEKTAKISNSAASYLYFYFRKCGAAGFFICMDNGYESIVAASTVYLMCQMMVEQYKNNKEVQEFLNKLNGGNDFKPKSAKEICRKILYTASFSTSKKEKTQEQDKTYQSLLRNFLKEIGCVFYEVDISNFGNTMMQTVNEGIYEQNVKISKQMDLESSIFNQFNERSKMLMSYFIAQLIPTRYNLKSFIIVVTALNLDDQLIGNYTKYGTTSGDIDLYSTVNRNVILEILQYFQNSKIIPDISQLLSYLNEKQSSHNSDLSYDELQTFSILRKENAYGPVSMFNHLAKQWSSQYSLEQIRDKVKTFFIKYAENRNKANVITPSVHLTNNSADDNRYDLRPMFYNCQWDYQFKKIDENFKRYQEKIQIEK